MTRARSWWRRPGLLVLAGATVACYAVGYPVALVAGSPLGWVLVFAGGVLLLALAASAVRSLASSQRRG
jgi:hypothetical protein